MACSIIINPASVVAIQSTAGQQPDRIVVSGTANPTECPKVLVQVVGQIALSGEFGVDATSGQWMAVFRAPDDFTQGDWPCDAANVKIRVECVPPPPDPKAPPPDPKEPTPPPDFTCVADLFPLRVPCVSEDDCPNQAELNVVNVSNPSLSVIPGQCVPPGDDYQIIVISPQGSNILYRWSLNGVPQPGASGVGRDTFDLVNLSPDTTQTVSVIIELQDIPGCFLSVAVPLTPCQEVECPPVTVTVRPGRDCNEKNKRTMFFEVTVGEGEQIQYRWDFGDDTPLTPLATGSGVFPADHNYAANITYFANLIIVDPPGCTATPDPIRVIVDPCPGQEDCPINQVTLEVIDSNGTPVTTQLQNGECLPSGQYVVRAIVEPPGATNSFSWTVDGFAAVVGQRNVVVINGDQLTLDLTEFRSVTVTAAGCAINSVDLRLCKCPDSDLGITVTTADGAPVDPSQCVSSGLYRFTAEGDVADAQLQWTADGQDIGNGTEVTFNFDPPSVSLSCSDPLPASTISLTASSSDLKCPDVASSVTLTLCRNNRFCVGCWLLRLLIIFFATISAIGLAVWICPAVVIVPILPIPPEAQLALQAILLTIAAAAPWITIIAGVIAVGLLLLWWWLCQPDWCNEWVVLFWQVLVSMGFAFIYFGTCPACLLTLLPIGVILFLVGVGVFVLWIIYCHPSLCKIFFEIGSLGLVQLLVGWLEFIIGACIWVWGWIAQLVWQLALNVVGWVGMTIACNVNPND